MENFLLKIKRINLQVGEDELVKDNLFKLNLTFKYYDFLKKSEQIRGYYVSEATPPTSPTESD